MVTHSIMIYILAADKRTAFDSAIAEIEQYTCVDFIETDAANIGSLGYTSSNLVTLTSESGR